jgi:hypothetical protein
MKPIAVIAICCLTVQCSQAGEAQTSFQTIADRLTVLVRNADTNAVITRDKTSFKAEFDTMVYTVHGGSKTGDFTPNTHQETGPKSRGFVITVSVLPLNPIAAESGQTMQQPYWLEYFWAGHGDEKEYIHFLFKFGRQVDEKFRSKIIKAVTETAQPPSPGGTADRAAPEK